MGILKFQLFGFPVAVLPGYWLLSALMGFGAANRSMTAGLQLVGIMFASILVHELGHAFAARAFGLRPQITLHMMGGATAFAGGVTLTRGRDIFISLAGPLAGFALGLAAFVALTFHAPAPLLDPEFSYADLPATSLSMVLVTTMWINCVWSVLNLMPVIPFDGGRILAAALGPRRRQIAGGVSLVVGVGLAVLLFKLGSPFAAVLFAVAALSSFFRMRSEANAPNVTVDEGTLKQALRAADEALRGEAFEQASQLSQAVLSSTRDPQLSRQALQTLLWARLGLRDAAGARSILNSLPSGSVDQYLAGAVYEAAGELEEAQRALSGARTSGDQRVEVTALLVKVLLRQRKFSIAANLTLEILQRIAPLEARRVATEARQGGAQAEAARLSLALAKAESTLTDATEALFGFALAGQKAEAVEAFTLASTLDASGARRLLEDERLRYVRPELEAALSSA